MPAYKTRLHISECYAYQRKCKRKAQYEVKGTAKESFGFYCSFCADRLIRDINKNRAHLPNRQEESKHDRSENID